MQRERWARDGRSCNHVAQSKAFWRASSATVEVGDIQRRQLNVFARTQSISYRPFVDNDISQPYPALGRLKTGRYWMLTCRTVLRPTIPPTRRSIKSCASPTFKWTSSHRPSKAGWYYSIDRNAETDQIFTRLLLVTTTRDSRYLRSLSRLLSPATSSTTTLTGHASNYSCMQ